MSGVHVLGHDVWSDCVRANQLVGILPDGLRLFDRLTGLQLICYSGLLGGVVAFAMSRRRRGKEALLLLRLLPSLGVGVAVSSIMGPASAPGLLPGLAGVLGWTPLARGGR